MKLKNGFLAMVIIVCPMASVADGIDTTAVIGGGLGGALGAAVGSGLGGRNGAIIGGALGWRGWRCDRNLRRLVGRRRS